ncbi:hypothetical protein GCM10009678_35320 [Actinomadura kijaniata]|uniref:DUF3592 domain-containing protein n=1 Tax=Actinomadura namibiensis TaxID=182080 RepID=A0A7W3QMR2_ACTNM|nr:hypothetical protein [Actinomadura namibiensis]MBA8952288.1 hypothetical protein [Actinomadura namibiensis]
MDQQTDGRQGTRWKRAVVPLIVGLALGFTGWTGFSGKYLDARAAVDRGVPGRYTVDACDRIRSSRFCSGTFRSDDGRVTRRYVRPFDEHDTDGVNPGGAYPARLPASGGPGAEAVRADAGALDRLRWRGVGWGGLGLLGIVVAGFGVLAAVRRPGENARMALGCLLALAGVASAGMWAVGLSLG